VVLVNKVPVILLLLLVRIRKILLTAVTTLKTVIKGQSVPWVNTLTN
jgi:hypothetical protein